MINRPDYRLATNAAYEIIFQTQIRFPAVDIGKLIGRCKQIELMTYADYAKAMDKRPYEFYCIAPSDYGFTIKNPNKKQALIVFNERKDPSTTKFTLAHELAHICLNHNDDNEATDKEANCFARNILCPLPAIEKYHLKTVSDYVNCFEISEKMAAASIENRSSDKFYITKNNFIRTEQQIVGIFPRYIPVNNYI